MSLPGEVRRKIYTFAVISVPPIELSINYHGGAATDTSALSRVRLYAVQDFRMLDTNHEFRNEMIDALYAKNAFDLSLWREDVARERYLLQIDLRRITKCRLILHNMETAIYTPRMNVWGGSFPLYWHHHLRALVNSLIFNGHHIEAMLVECERQNPKWLLECLRSMAMLRNIGLIQFRSCHPETYPYFRFLEARIMSDQAVPFSNRREFWNQTMAWRPHGISLAPRFPPPRITDMTGEGVMKSEEEIEDTAMNLYEIIEIADEMTPQKDL